MSQARYREIYREKALMNGGYTIGGGGNRRRGGAAKGYKCTCNERILHQPKPGSRIKNHIIDV